MSPLRRSLALATLIAAGEAVFLLPFVLARIFRPTFLDVFGLTNFQLGSAFSLYGVVAMASYFLGGPLADRFSARRLMVAALLATALGGVMFAGIPSLAVLTLLYGFWGLTTILLFWSALIRATREWGGPSQQGRAYGLLDGGRGLFAALLGSLSVALFASLLPADVASATLAERSWALSAIIWLFTGLIVGIAGLVWLVVPESGAGGDGEGARVAGAAEDGPGDDGSGARVAGAAKSAPGGSGSGRALSGAAGSGPGGTGSARELSGAAGFSHRDVIKVMRMRSIWLQALIVVCAYVGYKSTDDFSLFPSDAFGYDDVAAARIGAIGFWARPVAAVAAGFLADRYKASAMIFVSFSVMFIGTTLLALGAVQPDAYWLLILIVTGTSAGIYALRGIYFALMGEGNVPLAFTGTAVGVISFVGYTPDVFMGPLMGYLIDRSPGAAGHQHVFAVVAGFAAVGLLATLLFRRATLQAKS